MKVMPAGSEAVLVEVADLDEMVALYRGLQERRSTEQGRGITELVPALRTVLVEFDPAVTSARAVASLSRSIPLAATVDGTEDVVEVEAVYDGPDLAATCAVLGMTRAAFVHWHTGALWRVGFTGFSPGFAYLVSSAHRTSVPRLREPRTRVPAGSIAMADTFTGIYPSDSPGGWQLVGRTDHVLFDLAREPIVALVPGTSVRFVETAPG